MRVLFVSHSADVGGAEVALAEAVTGLAKRGVESHVALPEAGPLEERLRADTSVWVAPEPWPWWLAAERSRAWPAFLRGSPRAVRHVRARIRDVRPDVVVTNTSTFPQGAIASRLERVPHVWYVHEFGLEDLGLQNLCGDALGYRLMGALSARVIACSHVVADKLRRAVPAKVRVVYGAIEVAEPVQPLPPSPPPLCLLTLGRLHPAKGLEDAIQATAILSTRGLHVELDVVGGGPRSPYRPRLERLAFESGAHDRIHFRVHSPTPGAELARAHVFLMTSRAEAFGRVTIEAMKAGNAVVAASSGGSLELVRDGWNGLRYQPGDADDLARQVARLHDDPALRAELADRGLSWARERFTLDRLGEDLHRVLAEAARSARA